MAPGSGRALPPLHAEPDNERQDKLLEIDMKVFAEMNPGRQADLMDRVIEERQQLALLQAEMHVIVAKQIARRNFPTGAFAEMGVDTSDNNGVVITILTVFDARNNKIFDYGTSDAQSDELALEVEEELEKAGDLGYDFPTDRAVQLSFV